MSGPPIVPPDGGPPEPSPVGYGIEEAPPQSEAPRRSASAQFDVASRRGDAAEIREAMDPANQSLAEALRLSYRLLQLIIVVLVGLFLLSGFQTIQEGYTGVRTLFGRIHGDPGQEQLRPGFVPFWPYPVGDIVTVPVRRTVELDRAFWPRPRREDVSFEAMIEAASSTDVVRPGIDGSLLTADGDIVHLRIAAEYVIDDARDFLERIDPARADGLVRRVLQRAAVQTASGMTTTEIIEGRDEPVLAVRTLAQELLRDMSSGITLVDVRFTARTPVLAVRKELPRVQTAREEARALVERARQEAEKTLNQAAGRQYPELVRAIAEYEAALTADDEQGAAAALESLVALLQSPETSGQASMIISRARSYQAQVDATIGNDFRRYESLLPAWRRDPQLVARRLWLDAYSAVLDNPLLEIFSSLDGLGWTTVRMRSSEDVMQSRRQSDVERRTRDFFSAEAMEGPYLLRGADTRLDAPGRRLERGAEGGFGKSGN